VEAPAEVAVPEVAVPEVTAPEVTVDVPDAVEAVEVPDPAVPEPVAPPPEAALAPVAEAPPAPPAERRALLGAGDPVENRAATPPEQVTKVEEAATEALALMREEAGAQLPDLGAAVASMKGDVSQLDEGFDWTLNWNSGYGGASAAGLDSTCTLDGACLPQNLRGDWLGGDRPIEDRLGGLLEALLPEGMSLGEAAGGLELPGSDPLRHRSEGRRSQAAAEAANDLGAGSALAPPGGGLAALSPASAGAARSPTSADSTAGGASGPGPVRDPVSEPPEPFALAAGLAPGTGGGGGGAFFVLLIAALVGGLALLPPPPGERVHALGRRLTSLLSSSRLERPG
jgi:hypothetical protein